MVNMKRVVGGIEQIFLLVIVVMTVVATGQEIWRMFIELKIELKDLLLMFIYAEVLGMISAYYTNNRIPVSLPLFIAMTALARMIVLQSKDLDPAILLYESGSILLIAISWWIIRKKTSVPL